MVFDDADLDAAVTALVSVWAFHSGQICTAPTRAILHRPVYEQLVERLAATAPRLRVGPPTDPATVIGPVISAAQRERVEHYVELGRQEGARHMVAASGLCRQESALGIVADGCERRNGSVCCSISSANAGSITGISSRTQSREVSSPQSPRGSRLVCIDRNQPTTSTRS